MKRIVAIFSLLMVLAAGLLFAQTVIPNAQSTQVTAEMQGFTELKLSRKEAIIDIPAFMKETSLKAIEFGTIEYGVTYAIDDVYLNIATNRGTTIGILAYPLSPLKADGINTAIGFKLASKSGHSITIDKRGTVTSSGNLLYKFNKDEHGMILHSAPMTIGLNSDDVNAAEAAAYAATIKFEIVID